MNVKEVSFLRLAYAEIFGSKGRQADDEFTQWRWRVYPVNGQLLCRQMPNVDLNSEDWSLPLKSS